ncbi:MAG TPA: hypothetical protein VGE52_15640 [Pirellulales bacterium]
MIRFCSRRGALALAASLFLAGCSGEVTYPVSGVVTYDGQPLANGNITFLPADGRGAVDGAPIVNGKYEMRIGHPGEKFVMVEAVDATAGPISSEEANAKGRKPTKPAVVIPPNATGNNQKHTVKGGETALNFDLKSTLVKGSGG